MTDYAIRINIYEPNQSINIYNYLTKQTLVQNQILISPIEIGQETKKEHIHIYLKTVLKKDTLVKTMKKLNLIQNGNQSYSWVQITNKHNRYTDLNEAIQYYKAYCIKSGKPNYYNINISSLPKWVPKSTYRKKKNQTLKELIYTTYEPNYGANYSERKDIPVQILQHILKVLKEEKRTFTNQTLKMYYNLIYTQYYIDLDELSEIKYLYQQFNPNGTVLL